MLYMSKGLTDEQYLSPAKSSIFHGLGLGMVNQGGVLSHHGCEFRYCHQMICETMFSRYLLMQRFRIDVASPYHGEWRFSVSLQGHQIEFVWGPLSGFGSIEPRIQNEDIFAY